MDADELLVLWLENEEGYAHLWRARRGERGADDGDRGFQHRVHPHSS